MARRVRQYLSDLTLDTSEESLQTMSLQCEPSSSTCESSPPQGAVCSPIAPSPRNSNNMAVAAPSQCPRAPATSGSPTHHPWSSGLACRGRHSRKETCKWQLGYTTLLTRRGRRRTCRPSVRGSRGVWWLFLQETGVGRVKDQNQELGSLRDNGTVLYFSAIFKF